MLRVYVCVIERKCLCSMSFGIGTFIVYVVCLQLLGSPLFVCVCVGCVRVTGAGLRDSCSVHSFISVSKSLCELLPASPEELNCEAHHRAPP